MPGQVLVMERRPVAIHYLKTWFALDFVSSFPLDIALKGRRMDRWRLPKLLKVRLLHKHPLQAAWAGCSRGAKQSPLSTRCTHAYT